jgi:hypothetical protein
LERLKAIFTWVDDSSDLSTFRRDIVDPCGPPVGSANMSTPSEEIQNKSSIGTGDLSSGRVVLDGVKLPVGRGPLRPTRGGGSTRGRGGSSLQQTQTRKVAQLSGLRFSSTVETNFAVVIESTASETSHDLGHPRKNRPDGIDSATPAPRRGRAPKNISATSQLVTPSPGHVGHPTKALSSGIGMRSTSAGRKVGRPRIYPLSKSKPKGRPQKSDPELVTPKFIPFLCEWRDCKAELHNLETLRRHIYSVHNKVQPSGAIACQWSKCGLTCQVHDKSTPNSTPEPKFVQEDHEFAGMQKFKDHMEKAHLIPFAWHMGDGPRGSTLGTFPSTNHKKLYTNIITDGSESDASTYLSDAAGNQITPSIASQVVEGGNAKINNARRLTQQKRLYDPALESPVELATPGMRAKFFMGTEWKKIKAPRRGDNPEFDQL